MRVTEYYLEMVRSRAHNNADARTAWGRGLRAYVDLLCDDLRDYVQWHTNNGGDLSNYTVFSLSAVWNGATSWQHFVEGGGGFVYSSVICETLCTQSEQKRYKGGSLSPVGRTWLDVERAACKQAWDLIARANAFCYGELDRMAQKLTACGWNE